MPRKTTRTKSATSAKGNGKVEQETTKQAVKAVTITTKEGHGVLPTAALSNIDAYLEATAAESAQYLQFAKGEWLAGVDEEEVEAGTEMVPNIAGITCGHVKWQDKVVVDEAMTPIVEGLFTPREALGDLDKDLWDVDDDGVPRDPWTRTTKVPLKDPATGEEFIYSTSSRGGIGAVGRLVSAIRKGQRQGNTGLPVIRLDVDDYKHKTYGKVFVPKFSVVGFKSEAELTGGEADLDADLSDSIPF